MNLLNDTSSRMNEEVQNTFNMVKQELEKAFESFLFDPFDILIEETREKYRVSWEKSLEKYKKYCEIQNDDFEWAIKHGYFIPKFTIEKILVEAKPRTLRAEYTLEIKDDLNYIIMHPELYELIEDYKNQNPLQRFVWNLKWGFKDCAENFRNWQGHMIGEDWDFWEILSGEWSSYE